jgi:serine/threonine protein kinase
MADSIINRRIGSYLIQERIKAGGVAIVYKAVVEYTDRVVAFKLLQSNWAEHDEVVNRFDREARIMKQLRHPHIVKFFDHGIYEGRPYIVMEYLPGGSLSERLKQTPHITLADSARLLSQIGSALDYAHSLGVVHRDLKPGNILLKDSQHAALTDFGIARALEHTILTSTGYMPGTPHYMSPEQARGATELNYLSDLYSLAVIAYLLSTGRLPFTGVDPLVIINQHLTAFPRPPSQLNPDLPSALDDALLKALSKEPTRRYDSAGEFALAYEQAVTEYGRLEIKLNTERSKPTPPDPFDDYLQAGGQIVPEFSETAYAALPPGISPAKAQPRRRGSRWLVAGAVAVMLLALGVIIFALEPDVPPELGPTPAGFAAGNVEAEPSETAEAGAANLDTATPDPTNTSTLTSTSTPTATATSTSSPTATFTPTITPTSTITPTPTPTPYSRDLSGLLDDFAGVGTAGRFNCRVFVTAYDFLVERLEAEDPEFEPARRLIDIQDAPLTLIYEDYCRDDPDNIGATVIFSLFADMRSSIEQFR